MKRPLLAGLVVPFLMSAAAMAQSPFDGAWKIDLNNAQMPTKAETYVLQNGIYECRTCTPPVNIRANGQEQRIVGDPYEDAMIVMVVDDHTVQEISKKNGKVMGTAKVTVSPDGNTATLEFTDNSNPSGGPITGKGILTRVAPGPRGSHAISGSWRESKLENFSDNGLLFTYKVEDGRLTMTTPTGQFYTAKLDGTDAPFRGDPGTTSVSVNQIDKNTIEETDKRAGRVTNVSRMTVSPDGKTMTIAYSDKLHGTTGRDVAIKQ